jgi:hypothetical protein
MFSVTVFTALLGSGSQHWMFLCSRAHLLAGWRPSHTNRLLVSTAVLGLSRNGRWFSLYKHRHGPHRKHRFQQLLHCCMLHSRYLAMPVSLAPQFLLCANMPHYHCYCGCCFETGPEMKPTTWRLRMWKCAACVRAITHLRGRWYVSMGQWWSDD